MQVIEKLKASLPLDQYGQGSAKSWQSLLKEIESGECQIEWDGDRPIRVIRVLKIDVSDPDGNSLYEAYQEFNDGRRRERGLWGISEKVRPNEDLQIAVVRAMAEELGVWSNQFNFSIDPSHEVEEKDSPSYPGLRTRYIKYSASACLDESAVCPEYVEVQSDKLTIFIWRQRKLHKAAIKAVSNWYYLRFKSIPIGWQKCQKAFKSWQKLSDKNSSRYLFWKHLNGQR